jgi:hypothetical protein
MFSCICGGTIELFSLLMLPFIWFITSVYNKFKYKKFIDYKNKHLTCKCNCHKNER